MSNMLLTVDCIAEVDDDDSNDNEDEGGDDGDRDEDDDGDEKSATRSLVPIAPPMLLPIII